MQLTGSMTALVTPMTPNGDVDVDAYQQFVDWQVKQGTDGLVAVGTTGESATLSHDEHEHVIKLCIEASGGRAPVIAGTGSNSTAEAISLTQAAQKLGADAALVVVPYYNKPNQRGLYAHFKAVHDATDISILLYDVPGRSTVRFDVETLGELAKLPRIVGIKDATADLTRPANTRNACGAGFIQLTGEDASVIPFLGAGGVGAISVTSNVAPALLAQLHDAWASGDQATANAINDRLMPLHAAMFAEPSPTPAKYALSLLGKMSTFARLPMVEVSDQVKAQIQSAMQIAGLID